MTEADERVLAKFRMICEYYGVEDDPDLLIQFVRQDGYDVGYDDGYQSGRRDSEI